MQFIAVALVVSGIDCGFLSVRLKFACDSLIACYYTLLYSHVVTPRSRQVIIGACDTPTEPPDRRMSRHVLRGFDGLRLTQLRIARGIGASELARVAGVSDNAIRNWEKGRVLPQIDKLASVMKILESSLDEVIIVPSDQRLLSDLRVLNGLTQPALAAATGIPTSTLAGIERGHRPLPAATCAKLADALGTPEQTVREAYARTISMPPRPMS